MIKNRDKLTEHQEEVLNAVLPLDTDKPIRDIYMTVYGDPSDNMSVRNMQQKLAPTFKAINEKISNVKIIPGKLKQTYRVIRKGR